MGTAVSHGVKIILQRDEFDRLLGECDRSVSDVWQACVDKHGIGIQLKTFRTLVANREQWQALYAWALTDTLGVRIKDLFVMVDMRGSDTPPPYAGAVRRKRGTPHAGPIDHLAGRS